MSKKYLDTVGLNKLVANILSKFAAKNHSHSNATTNSAGFMSSSDKVKLDGVSAGANRTIVDSTLSSTSVNAIQNKAVKTALDGKAASSHTHPTAQITGLDAALAGKAPSSHSHSADNITSGVLPIGRGGTGGTTAKSAQYNMFKDMSEVAESPADNYYMTGAYLSSGSATNGMLYKMKLSNVWMWIKSKTDQLYATRTHNHDSAYAAKTHNHDAANITSGTLSIARGGTGTTSVSGVRNMIGVNPIPTTGSGSAYVASVPHISTLVAGATFTMVPHVVSAAVSPTLNVNNLGAKPIRQRLSNSTLSTAPGATANWLAAGKPVDVMYDGQFWVVDFVRPNMASAYGELPMSNVSGLHNALNDKADKSHKHPEYINKSDIVLHTDGINVKSGSLNNNVTMFSASNVTLFSLSPLYATLTMGALYIMVNESASFSGEFGYIDIPGEFTRISQCDHPEISNRRWFTTISRSPENKGCTRITFVAAVPFLPSDKAHQWSGAPHIVLLA